MSKKKFEAPIVEVVYIEAADILQASAEPFDGEWAPIGGSKNDDLIH